jgi:hypothetical protein
VKIGCGVIAEQGGSTEVRAAILGENAHKLNVPSFEWSVRRAIDCRSDAFGDGTQAVNDLTSPWYRE